MKFSFKVIIFLIALLLIWAILNSYFLLRVLSLPLFYSRTIKIVFSAIVLFFALSYVLGRILTNMEYRGFAVFLEITGALWIGVLFIFVVYIFFADLLSFFGYFKSTSIFLRYLAIAISSILTLFAFHQGLRTPVVKKEIVWVSNQHLSGFRIVQISDLHLGSIRGENFLKKVVKEINRLNPDIVVITGDTIDTDGRKEGHLKNIFKEIKTKKGVYGVLGNHEHYHGGDKNPAFFEESGIVLLRNRKIEIDENLVIAGVDDLSSKNHFAIKEDFLKKALENRKEGYLILLSHSPLEVERASDMGVNLMLSGHCHNGQIWPFNFFSKMFYPYNYGRFKVKDMDLIITLGTGTWGPPMRFPLPGEIVLIDFK